MELDLARVQCAGELGDAARLFSESNARYLVEVEPGREDAFLRTLAGLPVAKVGAVTAEKRLMVTGVSGGVAIDVALDTLAGAWRTGLKI